MGCDTIELYLVLYENTIFLLKNKVVQYEIIFTQFLFEIQSTKTNMQSLFNMHTCLNLLTQNEIWSWAEADCGKLCDKLINMIEQFFQDIL